MQDATPLPKSELTLAEEELQNELRSMFELDTQTYLQTYEQVTQQLATESWTANIQELYRSIHTIKGGAVTVGADAVLATTTALEDMLSDLRYLQAAPPLQDGVLVSVLVEAGEVVSGSLLITEADEEGQGALDSALARLKTLHAQVKDGFLNEVDEHLQLCQDFAKQGFDLMVLDLEMAIEKLPPTGQVPMDLVNAAAQAFTDLETVGKDLAIGDAWGRLLQPLFELLIESQGELWRSRCMTYLPLLKQCALEGGKLSEAAKKQLQQDGQSIAQNAEPVETVAAGSEEVAIDLLDELALEDDWRVDATDSDFVSFALPTDVEETEADDLDLDWLTEVPDLAAEEDLDEVTPLPALSSETLDLEAEAEAALLPFLEMLSEGDRPTLDLEKEGQLLSQALQQIEATPAPEGVSPLDEFVVPEDFLNSLETSAATADAEEGMEFPEWLVESPSTPAPTAPKKTTVQREAPSSSAQSKVPKIPVPLDRLDRSAQSLVEILLSSRATQGRYQSLQGQVTQMVALSQENAAYITQLRQMQDDYALLQNLNAQSSSESGVKLEGYRSGYTAINRLLENSLRLTELGAETAATVEMTRQEFNKLNLSLKALQNSVEESRLISFKSVAFRLRAVIQDLINRFGKPVQFVIQGESQNLDAGTIQVLEPALLHLLRNAYDHGLELTEDRLKVGKSQSATIMLSVKRQGSYYYLTLTDDGRGIDRQKIAQLAQEKGLPLYQTESDDDLLMVICQSGFSSQSAVSSVSGRGVGMDVVKHQVESIGGTLTLETTLGQGSRFELKVPVPHLLVPCLVVKAGPQQFAIPTDVVQTMRLWDSDCVPREMKHGMDTCFPWERNFEGTVEPMMSVMQYWQQQWSKPDSDQAKLENAICLRIPAQGQDSASATMWMVIDDLVEELDLLINPLPAPLKAPTGMMGMSTLPTGEMIPVLEANVIAQTLMNPESSAVTMADAEGSELDEAHSDGDRLTQTNLILVVDDAALLRRRLEVSLINYGYEVQCCRDGLEAWNWLQENPNPGLMITDIEMPQMDGFTLVDRCRQSGRTFPVLVSSSRLSEEWSKEAQRVGANDYLTKGFSTAELIERVSSLMTVPVA